MYFDRRLSVQQTITNNFILCRRCVIEGEVFHACSVARKGLGHCAAVAGVGFAAKPWSCGRRVFADVDNVGGREVVRTLAGFILLCCSIFYSNHIL